MGFETGILMDFCLQSNCQEYIVLETEQEKNL